MHVKALERRQGLPAHLRRAPRMATRPHFFWECPACDIILCDVCSSLPRRIDSPTLNAQYIAKSPSVVLLLEPHLDPISSEPSISVAVGLTVIIRSSLRGRQLIHFAHNWHLSITSFPNASRFTGAYISKHTTGPTRGCIRWFLPYRWR